MAHAKPVITQRTPPVHQRSAASRPDSGRPRSYVVKVLGVRRPVTVSGHADARIAQVAARQRGCIDREQLTAAGLSNGATSRRTARGYLIRRHRGVYVVGHAAPTPFQAETAALLACGDGALLSHLTAAHIWNVLRHEPPADVIDVTVTGRHGPRPDGVRVHRTSSLTVYDIRTRYYLPVTSPLRTLIDLAELVDDGDLRWSVDEAIQERLVTAKALFRAAHEAKGRHGAPRLAAAAARHQDTGITRSEAEKLLRAIVGDSGLTPPQFNVRLHGYRFDAYWPQYDLVVEVDSHRYHSTRPKMEHDTAKGAAAVAAGLRLMRFTALQLRDRPIKVAAQLAQAIARADTERAGA